MGNPGELAPYTPHIWDPENPHGSPLIVTPLGVPLCRDTQLVVHTKSSGAGGEQPPAGRGGTGCQRTGASRPGPPRNGGCKHFHGPGISSMDPRALRTQMDPPSQEDLPREQVPT